MFLLGQSVWVHFASSLSIEPLFSDCMYHIQIPSFQDFINLIIFLDLEAIINLFEEFKDCVHFLRIFIFVGHHQQRESSPGQKSSDPDGAKSIRSTWPQPARKQLRTGQPVVLYQPRPHGDRIRGAGLLATQPFRRQKENTHVASLPVTDWKTHIPN